MRSSLFALFLIACSGEEAARRALSVRVDPSPLAPVTNDLGWTITLDEARLVASGLDFTVAGEAHASRGLLDLLVGRAHAHPGHLAGGEVAGELRGPFIADWADPAALGEATLFEGDFQGANLRLTVGSAAHGLADDDPLLGHAAYLAGRAIRGDHEVYFEARLAPPEPPIIMGLPFTLRVDPTTDVALGLALYPAADEGTVFDGLDFGALPRQDHLQPLPAADLQRLRRLFFSHDHHGITVLPSDRTSR